MDEETLEFINNASNRQLDIILVRVLYGVDVEVQKVLSSGDKYFRNRYLVPAHLGRHKYFSHKDKDKNKRLLPCFATHIPTAVDIIQKYCKNKKINFDLTYSNDTYSLKLGDVRCSAETLARCIVKAVIIQCMIEDEVLKKKDE